MANINADILRVVDVAATIETTLREKQLGYVSDTNKLAFKAVGGTVYYYGSGAISGSGTADYMTKWSDTDVLAASIVQDDGSVVTVGGHLAIDDGNQLRMYDSGSSHYLSFAAPALSASVNYVLPATDGSAGNQLQTDGAGNLTWAAASGLTGSGTTNTIPKFTSSSVIGDSTLTDDGTQASFSGDLLSLGASTLQTWASNHIVLQLGEYRAIFTDPNGTGTDVILGSNLEFRSGDYYALNPSSGKASYTLFNAGGFNHNVSDSAYTEGQIISDLSTRFGYTDGSGMRIENAVYVKYIYDTDAMTEDSSEALATQQSIKAYTDNSISTAVSGTTNYVAKFTGANVIGDSLIFDDGTNVGIGTATPSFLFHLKKNIATGVIHYIEDNGRTVSSIGLTSDNAYHELYNSSGTQTVVLNTSGVSYLNGGDVGIGISPSHKVHIAETATDAVLAVESYSVTDSNAPILRMAKSANATIGTDAQTADGEALGTIQAVGVNSSSAQAVAASIQFVQDGTAGGTYVPGSIHFYTGTNTAAESEAMVIDDTGHIGINTTPDSDAMLHIKGDTDNMKFILEDNNTAVKFGFKGLNSICGIGSFSNHGIRFLANDTPAMQLNTTGYLAIGDNFATGDSRVHIQEATAGSVSALSGTVLTLENSSAAYLSFLTPGSEEQGIIFGDVADNDIGRIIYSHSTNDMTFTTSASTAMTIDSSGQIAIGTATALDLVTIVGTSLADTDLRLTSSVANTTDKDARIIMSQYATGNSTGVNLIYGSSTTSANTINFGGGNNNDYAATKIAFWTGATTTTAIGTERASIDSSGNLLIGTGVTATAALDVNSDIIRLRTSKTPASSGASGNAGDICWDANYIYVCTATNTWERAAIATW